MLDSCLCWLTDHKSSFEVIVVSDGSTDKTCDVVMEYVQKYGANRVRLLKLVKNRGKGGAVGFVSKTILIQYCFKQQIIEKLIRIGNAKCTWTHITIC